MPSHEAGWAHADGALKGPSWLREPADANALVPHLWSTTARKVDGVLGQQTRIAVKTMQVKYGLPADSWPTAELLAKMGGHAAPATSAAEAAAEPAAPRRAAPRATPRPLLPGR